MKLRWIAAALVFCGCGAAGFSVAAGYRRQERNLQMLLQALEAMTCELRYRHSALPELCLEAGRCCNGCLQQVFLELADKLRAHSCADAAGCMDLALSAVPELEEPLVRNLRILGSGLGRFDAAGQLQGLESVMELVRRDLAGLRSDLQSRLRCCRTLGLCAGAALAILLL